MELCKGGPLPSYAKEFFPPLEEAAAAVIIWQLLGALHYLQMQTLSHGDICPANVLMLHFDKPPEQNVTKLIDFGAFAGTRTHDVPSTGLVMRALLGWCCGVKGNSLREANHSFKAMGDSFVYSEGGVAVAVSRAATDLLKSFAAADRDTSFTAEKALKHKWFEQARRGEVPRRKARPRRSPTKEEAKAESQEGKGPDVKKKLMRAQSGQLPKESEAKNRKDPTTTKSAKLLDVSRVVAVASGGWWGAAPADLSNFIPRLRTFCASSELLRAMLIVAADALDEDVLGPLRAAFQSLDGWCPDGILTVEDLKKRLPKLGCKEVPSDIDRLLLEADLDGVGVLDFTTFLAIAMGSQELSSRGLGSKVFNILDRDQDGTISASDLDVFMNKVASEEEVAAMLKRDLGKRDLNLSGFFAMAAKATKMELDFASKQCESHKLSRAAADRISLALTTSEGMTFPLRSDVIKAKRRILDLEAEKRRKELVRQQRKEKERQRCKKKKKMKERLKHIEVLPEDVVDPLTLSLLVESSCDSSESGDPISENRERTDTGDTATETVGIVDSTNVTFRDFRQMLHGNQRLLVSL